MSSEQHNKRQRPGSAAPAGDVNDAKIIAPATAGSSASSPSQDAAKADTPAGTPSPSAAPAASSPAASPARQAPGSAPAPSTPVGGGGAKFGGSAIGAVGDAAISAPRASVGGAACAPSTAAKPGGGASPAAGNAASSASSATARADEPVKGATVIHAATPPSMPPAGGGRGRGGWAGLLLLLLLMLGLAAAGWWYVQQRFLATERANAARLQEAEARAGALEDQIRQLRDAQAQLQARGNALETQMAETASQKEQLQALYDDVARVRGDSRLAEAERALELANQHLALAGNVRGALLALEGAEKSLADGSSSEAIGLRRSILQDIERLKSLPEVDLTRTIARLDEVISRVDQLPFLSDPAMPAAETPEPGLAISGGSGGGGTGGAQAAEPAADPASEAAGEGSALSRFFGWASQAGREGADTVWKEFSNLVQIRRIDDPDRLLLAPDQKRSIREGLRLQLLNARINLLNRNEGLFRRDLAKSAETIGRYFDVQQPEVKSAIDILTQLQAEPLQLNVPSLSESMEALGAARAESEKRF
ncbi:MAG: uroporphyrinogen-III C-methyltransferase [Lautropia sp.]|nr:uroporphyrinogen-III C-methyltransferase [Lautropia sp.]